MLSHALQIPAYDTSGQHSLYNTQLSVQYAAGMLILLYWSNPFCSTGGGGASISVTVLERHFFFLKCFFRNTTRLFLFFSNTLQNVYIALVFPVTLITPPCNGCVGFHGSASRWCFSQEDEGTRPELFLSFPRAALRGFTCQLQVHVSQPRA